MIVCEETSLIAVMLTGLCKSVQAEPGLITRAEQAGWIPRWQDA